MTGQYARFLAVGGTNAVVDVLTFNALIFALPTRSAPTLVAYNTVAVGAAIANSYWWNTRWTFRHATASTSRGRHRQRVLFLGQSVVNVVINDLVLGAAAAALNTWAVLPVVVGSNLAKLAAMFTASILSFMVMKLVVFRPASVAAGGRSAAPGCSAIAPPLAPREAAPAPGRHRAHHRCSESGGKAPRGRPR